MHGEDQAGHREPDPAHVVQVDEQERVHDAVPEGVHEPADLEGRDRAGEGREVRPEEPPHRETLAPRMGEFWEQGDVVVWREAWRGRTYIGAPVRIVEDGERGLAFSELPENWEPA